MPRSNEAELDAAVLVRDTFEEGILATKKTLEDLMKADPPNYEEVEDYVAIIKDDLDELKSANHKVLERMICAKKTDAEFKAAESKQRKVIQDLKLLINRSQRMLDKSSSSGNANTGNNTTSGKKLPKIELPKFSGDVREWLPYWSQFREIHENTTISNSDKFQYLIQSTIEGSEARDVVMSFPVCGDNYNEAVNQLEKMYGNEKTLVKVYVRDLLSLVVDNAQHKNTALSTLYFKLSAKLKALQTLKVTTDKCASVIYPLVESCLPEEILRTWQRHPSCQQAADGEAELKALMEFLQKEVDSENNIKMACGGLKGEDTAKERDKKTHKKMNASPLPTAAALISVNPSQCIFCGNNHSSEVCRKASRMSLKEKEDIIREKKACFRCLKVDLKRNHRSSTCKVPVICHSCGGKHQTVLCKSSTVNQEQSGSVERDVTKIRPSFPSDQDGSALTTCLNQIRSPDVILPTIRVLFRGEHGEFEGRALLDSASHHSYVLKEFAENVGMKKIGWEKQKHGVFGGGVTDEIKHVKYKLYISAIDGSNPFTFDVADCQRISSPINEIPSGPWTEEMQQREIQLHDRGEFASKIHVLIGADVLGKLMTGRKFQLESEPGLVAWESVFGWTLMGKITVRPQLQTNSTFLVMSLVNNSDVAKLWELDVLGITDSGERKTRQELEEAALDHFNKTVRINDEERYEVHLPFVEGHKPLPTNKKIAERRLASTTAALKRDGTLKQYDDLLKSWEEMGMIEEVTNDNWSHGHYLPHQAVYKQNSETTPIRPVFDASCKSKDHCSLNDCLEKGPNTVELIPALVARFRMNRVGVLADIKKAFQQISVVPEHRDFQKFLWWKDLGCQNMKTYRHCRVVFGVSSSPFILGATLQHLLKQAPPSSRKTSVLLGKSLYVDNVVASLPTCEDAKEFQSDANQIMKSGNFELRGWEIGPNNENKCVPLLGLTWHMTNDTLVCDIDHALSKLDGPVTKRKILSLAHTIFDPIGVTAPFTLIPKLLLQEIWALSVGWDEELNDEISRKFNGWRKQIPELLQIKVPRWIKLDTIPREEWQMFVFVDASESKAYAACVFIKVGHQAFLVQAKTRVRPLKKLTTPRLELMSCVIGVRLAKSVKEYIEHEDIQTRYFTDSSTALYWIKHPGNWGVFVQRRVDEVLRSSEPTEWSHIPGENNPADFPSRGGTVKQIIEKKFWEGPEWITKSAEYWPRSQVNINEEEIAEEQKKKVVSVVNIQAAVFTELVGMNYQQMLSYVNSQGWELNAENMKKAELQLVKQVQEEMFSGTDDEKLKRLPVVRDSNGLIRLKTRLGYGTFTEDFKYPVVLPSRHLFVTALIIHSHLTNTHAGTQTLMAILREKWWILKSRRTIRNTLKLCEECQRYSVKHATAEAAPLPKERMQAEVPFQITGVDMFGPLYLDDGSKCWVALFTCAVYRAVHLELVQSLDTPSFKNALRRFIARRGRPEIIFSDNGTNFRGLDNAFKKIDMKEIQEYGAVDDIVWRFSPPTASWWGGFWERMVGVVKVLLRKVLGKAHLNLSELETLLFEVESTVNQRPLTYVSEDTEDLRPLTPFLFLTGNKRADLPEADIIDGKNLRKRWNHIQKLREDLRSRFLKEYLGQLGQIRDKPGRVTLEVGEKVLIGRDNAKRIDWPLGVVVQLIKSRDGKVRVAKVKTEDGVLTRPVQRIYPMEYREEKEDAISRDDSKNEIKTRSGREIKIPARLTFVNVV